MYSRPSPFASKYIESFFFSPSCAGMHLMEANPPLFSSERLPEKNRVLSWVILNFPSDTPPMTLSLTLTQVLPDYGVLKLNINLSLTSAMILKPPNKRIRIIVDAFMVCLILEFLMFEYLNITEI